MTGYKRLDDSEPSRSDVLGLLTGASDGAVQDVVVSEMSPEEREHAESLLHQLLVCQDEIVLNDLLPQLITPAAIAAISHRHLERLISLIQNPLLVDSALASLWNISRVCPGVNEWFLDLKLYCSLRSLLTGHDSRLFQPCLELMEMTITTNKIRDSLYVCHMFVVLSKLMEDHPSYIKPCARIIRKMCCFDQFPPYFVQSVLEVFSSLFHMDDELVITALDGIFNLCINGANLSGAINCYSPLMDDLVALLQGFNREVRLKCIEVLEKLCVADDQVFHEMMAFGAVDGVRRVIADGSEELVKAGLGFFRSWLKKTVLYKDHIIAHISRIDFVTLCEKCSYEAKRLMVDLVLRLCENVTNEEILVLLNERFVEIFVDNLSCLGEKWASKLLKAFYLACEKGFADTSFIKMMNQAIRNTDIDNEVNSEELARLTEFVEDILRNANV
jgi:hypothetical protein